MESPDSGRSKAKPRLEIVPEHQPRPDNIDLRYKHHVFSEHSPTTTSSSSAGIAHPHNYGYAPNNPILSQGKDRVSYVPGSERFSITHRLSTRSTASTTRDSIASSILSRSLSTASTALTRYSSVRSSADPEPVFTSPISPWSPYPGKETVDPPRSYWCTLCRASFESINEWKSHELECQDTHLLRTAPDDVVFNTVRPSAQRNAWGCGFCAGYSLSLPEYLDHVGSHYDEGRGFGEWRHSSVIRGLLRQPGVDHAWRYLVSKKEHVAGSDSAFFWDPKITGRSSDATNMSSPRLQDLLECFATGDMKPQAIAKAAYDLACVTAPDQTENTVHELSMHIAVNPIDSVKVNAASVQTGPPIPSKALPETESDAPFTSVSNTASETQNQESKARGSYTFPTASTSSRFIPQAHASKIYVKVQGAAANPSVHPGAASSGDGSTVSPPQRRSALRRVESERDLSVSRPLATTAVAAPSFGGDASLDISPSPSYAVLGRASPLAAVREVPGEDRNLLAVAEPNEASSVRSHSNSSVLSAQTEIHSFYHDDSDGELVSIDSASEPDLLLEVEGDTPASREWSRLYHQTVERVMEQLWSQYNHDWDQLIRGHAGGSGSSSHSRGGERDSGRRGQSSGSSRYPSARSLRPVSRYPIDGGDDEEDDFNRYPGRSNSSSAKSSPTGGVKFACPYRKHDPQTYNVHDHQVCMVHSWPTIPRLKEHLYRKHYIAHCQRCKRVFRDDDDLRAHEMALQGCTVVNSLPPCDITTAQAKLLKSRSAKNKPKLLTPREKWEEIYRLLFPDDNFMPSPYPEYIEDLGPISPESRDNLGIQHYLLLRMPELFRQAAEEYLGGHIQAREVLRMDAISNIIQDSLNKAFREYETSNSHGTSSQPTPSPRNLTNFAPNDNTSYVPSSSSSTMPPWPGSEVPQIGADPFTPSTMQPATTWPSVPELTQLPLPPAGINWISPTTTATYAPYDPYPSASVMGDPGFSDFLDPTSHGDPYGNHDIQMSDGTLGDQGYF